ncbi:hypothetical protein [Deinococcus enclensis]|uniref:Uncharacterized protein n=1 Tax=Deinococcus enclensis TaxID=1049582 RepID=A0ABT9MG50_9DEIO|nr:hypothetical protein [Deinococcus enclensis]MDP9765571.1 hypothetical protein [Deinococcus enclensis]
MKSNGPGSPLHERLLADLRAGVAAAAEYERQAELDGRSGSSTLDRDDDGQWKASTTNPLWDRAEVDRRLDELSNSRWTRPWRRTGEGDLRPPLIEEVDASGVDRREISRWISPEELEQQVKRARWARARQAAAGDQPALSFQHHLIQALQDRVAQAQLHLQAPAPLPVDRPWAVGDLVRYCGEEYFITLVTPRKITCESQHAGAFDLVPGSAQAAGLRLVAAGLRVVPDAG